MRISGLQRAEVVDTADFPETGLIRVRLLGSDVAGVSRKVEVLTPYGGLANMGMQVLPPIGAHGMVLFEQNQDAAGVWVGSILLSYGSKNDEGMRTPVEAESPEDFVIKTQYTTKDSQELDTKENKVENIIKLNRDAITLAKVKQDDGKYTYHKEAYDLEEDAINLIKLEDSEIKIKYKFDDNSKENTISLTEDGIGIGYDTEDGKMAVNIAEKEVQLSAGGTLIKVSKDGSVDITVPSGKYINLNGSSNYGTLYEGFRDFVQNVFNNHVHATNNGPTFPPTAKGTSNSAKSKSVKLT